MTLFTNQVTSRMFVWREKATHRMRFSRLTKSTPAPNALAASTRLLRCAPLGIFNRQLSTRPLCEPSAFDFQLKLPTFNSELPTRRPGANSRRMRTYPNRGLNAFIMNTCRKEGWGPGASRKSRPQVEILRVNKIPLQSTSPSCLVQLLSGAE